MIPKKNVTEEDLHITEALISQSFSNLMGAISKVPEDMTKPVRDSIKPVTGTIKEHPYASIAAAAGVGIIAYQFIRLVTPRVVVKEVRLEPEVRIKEDGRSSAASQILALAAPYIAGYLQQEISRLLSKPKE